jgi:hypothetical protein
MIVMTLLLRSICNDACYLSLYFLLCHKGNGNIYFVQSLQNEDRMPAEFCVGCPEDEKNVFALVNEKFLVHPSWGGHTDTSA